MMAHCWSAMIALIAVTSAGTASAQNAPIQSSPLPPLQRQWQQEGSPPVQQAPATAIPPSATAPTVNQPTQPPVAMQRPNVWVPAAAVRLEALDKVNAQATKLTIKVGQSATFGSLTITVKSCVVRPPDQPADAAAFLSVTDSHLDSTGFNGWMLADEPSVSMMQHPVYDLRVTGCA